MIRQMYSWSPISRKDEKIVCIYMVRAAIQDIVFRKGSVNSLLKCSAQCRRRRWHPTPVLLPGKFHGQRSPVGCNPWGHYESDTTEWFHFHFSLSCSGEGNGNPLQCSCLESPRDREPGGLPSMRLHRVGHDWSNLAAAAFKKDFK